MIRVNLLPHREEKRKARRIQFFAMSGLVVTLAGVIWLFGFLTIGRWIDTQNERNEYLKKEIAILDKDIEEIKRLKEEIEVMLARNRVIETLQATRSQTVNLFTELAKATPEGIYLKTVKQTGGALAISGSAQASARVSEYMQRLDASPFFERPNLIVINASTTGKVRLSDFSLNVAITPPAPPPAPPLRRRSKK